MHWWVKRHNYDKLRDGRRLKFINVHVTGEPKEPGTLKRIINEV